MRQDGQESKLWTKKGPDITQYCRGPMWNFMVNIGSGNGLVPSGTKPLPEPMLNMKFHIGPMQCWVMSGPFSKALCFALIHINFHTIFVNNLKVML